MTMKKSPSRETIEHQLLEELIQSGAVQEVKVVGKKGWEVVVSYGHVRKWLAGTKTKEVRIFTKLETAAVYLKKLGVHTFIVDTTDYIPTKSSRLRPDRAEILKKAYAAAKENVGS